MKPPESVIQVAGPHQVNPKFGDLSFWLKIDTVLHTAMAALRRYREGTQVRSTLCECSYFLTWRSLRAYCFKTQ